MAAAEDQTRAAVEQLLDLVGEGPARRILADVGRRTAQQELERVVVLRLAVRLLAEHAPRSLIRDRLVSRGIHERTAYRTIGRALGLGPRNSDTDTPPMSDDWARMPPSPSHATENDPCL